MPEGSAGASFRYSKLLLILIAAGVLLRAALGWITGAPVFGNDGLMGLAVVALVLLLPVALAMDLVGSARSRWRAVRSAPSP